MSGHLASLVLFCFVMAATPGPNNLMVMASAARYGVRRTLPHLLGVTLGFPAMLALIGAGLGELIQRSAAVHTGLEAIAVLCTLGIAWRIAVAGTPHEAGANSARPLNFFEAALFQWINPKAWAIGFVAVALYAHQQGSLLASLTILCCVFILVCTFSLIAWAALGRGASRLFRTAGRFRLFNVAMATLLVLAMVPLGWSG